MTERVKLATWLFAVAQPSAAGCEDDIWGIIFVQQSTELVLGHVHIEPRSGLARFVTRRTVLITLAVAAIAKFMRRQEANYARRRAAASAAEAPVR